MIKAIILDVDGIIVGEKIGYNSPNPHASVMRALKSIREKGIAVSLCTAKPHYAIEQIIKDAALHNPHITDAGAVIIDPIDNVLVEKHVVRKSLAKKILKVLLDKNVYTEFYTVNDYYISAESKLDITAKHTHILQKEPSSLINLIEESKFFDITKIMPIAQNDDDKKTVSAILEPFKGKVTISWGVHPIALPLQFGIITALGSSKKNGAQAIVTSMGISFAEVLGIGDSTSDWNFIQLCGYAATLANGSEELKKKMKTKNEDNNFISTGSVDENGILEIFKKFGL